MPNAELINIQIDPVHLRKQIQTIIEDELAVFAGKLHYAADALDPEGMKLRDEWIKEQIEKGVAKRLKEEQDA